MSRISPAVPPHPASVQAQLDAIMPKGMTPLWLFRVLARDERLFTRFFSAGLLDRGHLSLNEREIVILRVCANHRSEYEWGVHVTIYAERAGLTPEQVAATLEPSHEATCWSPHQRLLLRLCDELSAGTELSDELWNALEVDFAHEALLELLLLSGLYRLVSVLTNTLRMPLEAFAARFPGSGVSSVSAE
jgi:alkylhydroperoxidase family enzyme